MALKLANNAVSRLAAGIATGDTSISVTPGEGAKFPSLTGGDYFPATLIRSSDSAIEIVKVTARSTDTLTVTRAQESTSAKAFVAGDRIELRFTSQTFTDEIARVEAAGKAETQTHAATSKSSPVDADEIPLVDSEASNALKKLTWANIKAGIFSAWGALINGGTAKTTPVDADAIAIMDSAASNATKKLTIANLKAYIFGGGALTGLLKFAKGSNVASAATVDLTAATGNTLHITGTTAITAFTMTSGQVMDLIFDGVLTLTNHATNNALPGAANITTAAGDRARYFYDGTTVYCLQYQKADGTSLVNPVLSVNGKTGAITSVIVNGTAVASTSGSSVDFTGIPSWARRITVLLGEVSTSGSSKLLIQIGSGSVTTTGYVSTYFGASSSSGIAGNSTAGFILNLGSASDSTSGSVSISLLTGNTYVAFGGAKNTTATASNTAGSVTLSGVLDRVRITTVNGTDTFDAGSINILYE